MGQSRTPSGGLTLAPVLIRLALGVTFIWAGWAKINGHIPVQGEDAAILANLGILPAPTAPAPGAPPDVPAKPLPSPHSLNDNQDSPRPATAPLAFLSVLAQASPAAQPRTTFSASDFPSDTSVRAVWAVALTLYRAGHPGLAKDGKTLPPTWPPPLADGPFPRYFAMALAITELAGGVLVLIGWMTRCSALGLACTMLGAIWLDQIGPHWQTGNLMFGFLPAYDLYDVRLWAPLLWQFALLCAALSLLIGGSGRLAIDWAIRRPGGGDASRPPPRPANPPSPAGAAP